MTERIICYLNKRNKKSGIDQTSLIRCICLFIFEIKDQRISDISKPKLEKYVAILQRQINITLVHPRRCFVLRGQLLNLPFGNESVNKSPNQNDYILPILRSISSLKLSESTKNSLFS